MAGAAGKKAAAARKAAAATYKPILLVINVIYLALHFRSRLTIWNIVAILLLCGLNFIAYRGILAEAENATSNQKELVGGIYLDLLGLVVVIQFGSVLVSSKFCYLLIAIPVVGGYKLYKTLSGAKESFMGGSGGGAAPASTLGNDGSTRRQRRAEKKQRK